MKKKAMFMGAALICSAFSAFAYNENELMLGTDGKIRYNTDSSELEYSNDAGITWAAIGSGGGGNVTGSVVKVDGTALSTANFVDSSDINATASGSSVTMALTTTASNNIAKGVTAYGWGNHSAAGYLTDAPIDGTQYARKDGNWTTVSVVSVETDPIYTNSTAHGIGAGNITRWDSSLQNETDTLATVTARGNNTTYGINVASIDVSGKSVTESLQVTTGAANGYVLTSDSGGNATWQNATGGVITIPCGVYATFNGGGSSLINGTHTQFYIPNICNLTSVTVGTLNTVGNVIFDIKTTDYSNYPNNFTSIVSTTPPTVTNSTKYQDTTLSGWNKTLNAGSYIDFSVIGDATNITDATIILGGTR